MATRIAPTTGLVAALALLSQGPAAADVTVSAVYDAPADAVWAVVDFHAPSEVVMPPIASSRLEGQGIGAIKINTLDGGGNVRLQLVHFDAEARGFNYVIRSGPLPVSEYVGEVRVTDLGDGRSELTWRAVFDPAGVSAEEADAILQGFLESIAARLGEIFPREG